MQYVSIQKAADILFNGAKITANFFVSYTKNVIKRMFLLSILHPNETFFFVHKVFFCKTLKGKCFRKPLQAYEETCLKQNNCIIFMFDKLSGKT